jgi:hypothetical protein
MQYLSGQDRAARAVGSQNEILGNTIAVARGPDRLHLLTHAEKSAWASRENAMNKLIRTMQVAFLKMRAERHHARGEERDYLIVMQQLRALAQSDKRQTK